MKLTKDDKKHFLDGDEQWFGSPDDREKLWEQILKNQEKAEDFDKINEERQEKIVENDALSHQNYELNEIVERLKKRLEYPFDPKTSIFQTELQKILGEENDTLWKM